MAANGILFASYGSVAAELSELDPFFAYDRAAEFEPVRSNIAVPVRDGSTIGCQLYRPGESDGGPADGRFPGIVYAYTAYAGIAEVFGEEVSYYVSRGYNGLVCQARGATDPNGVLQPFGPSEQQDNYDVIEWFAAQSWSTGNIGQMGVSYGAHSALLVAVNQPPSLRAIIPINGIHDWYENTIYRGGIYSHRISEWQNWVAPNTLELYADNPLYNDFWKGHSVMARWDRLDIPTLEINGWFDRYRDGMVKNYLARPENTWLVSGPWQHGDPEGQPEGLQKGAYLAWWDRWLAGDEDAPLPKKHVTSYEIPGPGGGTGWQQFEQWPPRSAVDVSFALNADGSLSIDPGPAGHSSYRVNTDPRSGLPDEQLVFSSAPLERDMVIAGSPAVRVQAAFETDDGNLAVAVFDVAPTGEKTRVTAGWLKASHRISHESLQPVSPGVKYDLPIRLWPVHYRFSSSHRIEVRVSSDDYPEITNDAPPGEVAMYLGSGGSTIAFPVIGQ